MNPQLAGSALLIVLSSVFAVITTILWLVIGWRAMRAHERIADVLAQRSRES